MAATSVGFGEHRFGPSLVGRLVLVFGVLLAVVLVWAMADKPSPSLHPGLLWASVGIAVAGAGAWIAIGKTALIISDQGVRRESVFGVQEIPWAQIQ